MSRGNYQCREDKKKKWHINNRRNKPKTNGKYEHKYMDYHNQ